MFIIGMRVTLNIPMRRYINLINQINEDVETFNNELDHEIRVEVEEKEIDGVRGVRIDICGPDSEHENNVTWDEATVIRDLLNKVLGESQIVIENVIPDVVYHGTNAQFDRFEKPAENRMAMRSAVGFWFSSSKEEAAKYGSRVVSARLSIKKPRRITRRKLDELAVSYPLPELMRKLRAGGYDGLIVDAIKADPIMDEPGKAEEYVVFSADQIQIID